MLMLYRINIRTLTDGEAPKCDLKLHIAQISQIFDADIVKQVYIK